MTDANEAVGDIGSSSTGPMPGTFSLSPPQRRRSTVIPRRVSSAPNLHSPSSLASTSASSDEPSSSGSSSSSRSSYSHREWHSHEIHQARPHVAPLAPIHNRDRPQSPRSVTEPTPVPAPAPAPAPESDERPNMELMMQRLEEIRRTLSRRQRRASRPTLRGAWVVTRGFFGYGPEGTAARRELVSLTGKLVFGVGQIAATIALLNIGARTKSPTHHDLNEWQACRRPLGIWCAIWCVRVVLGCLMAIWGYRRRAVRMNETAERRGQGESSDGHASQIDPTARPPGTRRTNSHAQSAQAEASRQISAVTFARLTTLLSLFSLTWFITAHILIYTSVHTCRLSAPHLWWLTFGIICIGYLVIVEVILVAFLVFVLGPLIFVFLNIILICMGRHPLRHIDHINPEIGKLPHKAVDRIPLVLYIPAPVPKEPPVNGERPQASSSSPQDAPAPQLAVPQPAHVHSYPPESERAPASPPSSPGTRVQSRSRRLFTFRRIKLKKGPKDDNEKGKEKQSESQTPEAQEYRYEDKWEKGGYPFVKLEGNRAACAICLCDFEEPRRVRYSLESRPPQDLDEAEKGLGGDSAQTETGGELKLTDAGEGAQPLRLLDCAHVFHKTCLDPWLTEVSGRCPVCQRPVEVSEEPKDERTSRHRRRER